MLTNRLQLGPGCACRACALASQPLPASPQQLQRSKSNFRRQVAKLLGIPAGRLPVPRRHRGSSHRQHLCQATPRAVHPAHPRAPWLPYLPMAATRAGLLTRHKGRWVSICSFASNVRGPLEEVRRCGAAAPSHVATCSATGCLRDMLPAWGRGGSMCRPDQLA